jgi:hypothetical protein
MRAHDVREQQRNFRSGAANIMKILHHPHCGLVMFAGRLSASRQFTAIPPVQAQRQSVNIQNEVLTFYKHFRILLNLQFLKLTSD